MKGLNMINAKDINRSKELYNELAWIEVYEKLISGSLNTRNNNEIKISECDLKCSAEVQYRNTQSGLYVWNKLASLGYKVESYYDYPNGNGDSGLKITWE